MAIQSSIKKLFTNFTTLDPRGYVALRIGLAVSILLDLCTSRLLSVPYFLSDAGVLPRKLLIEHVGFSLFNASGSAVWAYVLLCILGISALSIAIGYKTKTSMCIAYILLLSLHWRAEFILGGPDRLHLLVHMWAMFLPLGAYGSIDAYHTHGTFWPRKNLLLPLYNRIAVLGMILLMVSMYLVAAYVKLASPNWYQDFTTVYYVLNTGYHTTPFGYLLRNQLLLTQICTAITIITEWCLGILLLLPFYIQAHRAVFSVLIILLKLGFGSMLFVSLFPPLGIAIGLLFMPDFLWNALPAFATIKKQTKHYAIHFARKTAPTTWAPALPVAVSFFLVVLLSYNLVVQVIANIDDVIEWDLGNSPIEMATKHYMRFFRIEQGWYMFRNAPKWSSWPEVIVTLEDGTERDIWRQRWQGTDTVGTEGPKRIAQGYLNSLRLFLYYDKISKPDDHPNYHLFFAFYHCKEWARNNEIKATAIDYYYNYTHWQDIAKTSRKPRKHVWNYECPESTQQPPVGVRYKYMD